MPKPLVFVGAALVAAALSIACILHLASFLEVEDLRHADAIIVLAGDINDRRYQKGIELLRTGYAQEMFLDASEDVTLYGNTYADRARQFVHENPNDLIEHVQVCPIREDSTVTETKYVAKCLSYLRPGSQILIVTSDYHSRRALSVFRHRLPSFRWSVVAAHDDTQFGTKWWAHREWAKNAVREWQKLLWWEVIERWG